MNDQPITSTQVRLSELEDRVRWLERRHTAPAGSLQCVEEASKQEAVIAHLKDINQALRLGNTRLMGVKSKLWHALASAEEAIAKLESSTSSGVKFLEARLELLEHEAREGRPDHQQQVCGSYGPFGSGGSGNGEPPNRGV